MTAMPSTFDNTLRLLYNKNEICRMEGYRMAPQRLIRGFTALLFPFRFSVEQLADGSFNPTYSLKNGSQTNLWLPAPLQPYHLKEHVAAMLGTQGAGDIGSIWQLNDALRRRLNLPDRRTPVGFTCRGREEPSTVYLDQARLALFTTGVGFLELTVEMGCASGEEMQDVNYFLCEVKSDANRLHFEKRLGKDSSETVTFSVLELVERLLAPLGEVEDFDTRPGLHYIDNKPIICSYVLLERFDADAFGQLLFGLRTNFKASYHPPQEAYALTGSPGVLHPFENVYWGASLNGMVCCAALTGQEKTDAFFTDTFPSNFRQTYLLLHLLRQHQRYAVQDLQRRFASVGDGLNTGSTQAVNAAYDRVRQLLHSGVVFKLKCRFRDPSSVEHINAVDTLLVDTLQIRENLRDFEDSVRQLQTVAGEIKAELDARKQRRKRLADLRKEGLIYLITALWGCVVFLQSSWEVVEKISGVDIRFNNLLILIPLVITLLPLYKMADELRRQRRKMKEMEEEIKKDK